MKSIKELISFHEVNAQDMYNEIEYGGLDKKQKQRKKGALKVTYDFIDDLKKLEDENAKTERAWKQAFNETHISLLADKHFVESCDYPLPSEFTPPYTKGYVRAYHGAINTIETVFKDLVNK